MFFSWPHEGQYTIEENCSIDMANWPTCNHNTATSKTQNHQRPNISPTQPQTTP